MFTYDPLRPPSAAEWLATAEAERLAAVERAHARHGLGDAKRDRLHAIMHVVVENQLAEGSVPAVGRTCARLEAAGVDRHNALHAIASVMSRFMFDAAQGKASDPASYATGLDALDPRDWRPRRR